MHIGEIMRDAFVAIDTSLFTSEQKTLVGLDSPWTLSVVSFDWALWQLRHSRESLAFMRAHS